MITKEEHFKSSLRLRPYQIRALESSMAALLVDKINPLVVSATGTGKSIMIASLIHELLLSYPKLRILCLAHRRELIEQNHSKLCSLSQISSGIYCAGLHRYDVDHPVIFASPQSLRRKESLLFPRHLILIDEPHLIPTSPNSCYRRVLDKFKENYPSQRTIGYTATPYRLRDGVIHSQANSIFDRIVFEYGILEGIKDGYLCPLTNRVSLDSVSMKGVKIVNGDYSLSESDRIIQGILTKILPEILSIGRTRSSWMVFLPQLKSCDMLSSLLNEHSINNCIISSSTSMIDRDNYINEFKNGKIRVILNVNCLTTGFDAPNVDMIVMLRPTRSKVLYAQILGRGLRLHPNKSDCLVLDYTDNIRCFGAVDKLEWTTKKKTVKRTVPPPVKICINNKCSYAMNPSLKVCPICFTDQPIDLKIDKEFNDHSSVLSTDQNFVKPRGYKVLKLYVNSHKSLKGARVLKLSFELESRLKPFTTFISFYKRNESQFGKYSRFVWRSLKGGRPIPLTTIEAINRLKELQQPKEIKVIKRGNYDQLFNATF